MDQVGWSGSSTFHSYFGGTQFKSQLKHQLY